MAYYLNFYASVWLLWTQNQGWVLKKELHGIKCGRHECCQSNQNKEVVLSLNIQYWCCSENKCPPIGTEAIETENNRTVASEHLEQCKSASLSITHHPPASLYKG